MSLWNGFEEKKFYFEGRRGRVILPRRSCGVLAIKTEYWGAFPQTEIRLLEEGFTLAFLKNDDRWGRDEDIHRKARFVKYLQKRYGLRGKCVPIGMSCGGLIAVNFASRHPELVGCLYLDAPVMNFMSCPLGSGVGDPLAETNDEILNALSMSISQLICYRDMPMDRIPALLKHRIPVALVAGDSDTVVPFTENGILLKEAYEKTDIPFFFAIKPGCGHHPHGLEDPTPAVEFIKEQMK